MYCSVPGCHNSSGKNISMHHFPRDDNLQKRWVQVLKIGKPVSKYMYVCAHHFTEADFFYGGAEFVKHKRLKRGAVPSCKLPLRSHDTISTATQLANKAKRAARAVKRNAVPMVQHLEGCHTETVDDTHTCQTNSDNIEMAEAAAALMELHSICDLQPQVVEDVSKLCKEKLEDGNTVLPGNNCKVTLVSMIRKDEDLNAFTGIPTLALLEQISVALELFCSSQGGGNMACLDATERVVLTMCKLKLNISFVCIAVLFGVSRTTAVKYFNLTCASLAEVLGSAVVWPTKESVMKNMPKCFEKFQNTRIVLDCTECPLEKVKCLHCRLLTYSHYKGGHTLKFLVGVAPEGLITFCSEVYGGRASDKAIFLQSGLLQKLEPNSDSVMVDKGFLIENECSLNRVKVIRPPFLGKRKQFSVADGQKTADIARARVHVERTIQRLKIFKVLKVPLSWNMVPNINNIVRIITGLVNLTAPILCNDKFLKA